MHSRFIQVVASVITLLLVSAAPAVAETGTVRDIWIDGHDYQAVLEENLRVNRAGTAQDSSLTGRHYKGHFPEDPNSWVRISHLDSGWEGLAFVFGRLHTIGGAPRSDRATSFSFSRMEEPPQCGLDHIHGKSLITPDSLTGNAMAQAVSASYDTLCDQKVDGACLMLELELAFDRQFQDRFPNDYQGRAGAILNMVEGFYADQFGIVFDTLSLTFTGPGVFDSTIDAGTLLDDVTEQRRGRSLSFLESERSIFHLVSGRDFDGSTAGLAWVGTVCYSEGFASGITNAYNSNATTAVVIAHEIGHNLGASHDTPDNGCEAGVNIMSPYVVSTANRFSQCSDDAITERISRLNSVEQCFNFPADAGISNVDGNPLEVESGASFQTNFRVDYLEAAESADGLTVIGEVGDNEGELQGVSIGGTPCDLVDGTSFRCSGVTASPDQQLSISAVAGSSDRFSLLQNVSLVSSTGDVKDIRPDNDSLLTEIAVLETDTPAPSPDDSEDNDSPGTPRSNDSGSSGSADSGGGGGGALHWLWLLLGIAGVIVRGGRLA